MVVHDAPRQQLHAREIGDVVQPADDDVLELRILQPTRPLSEARRHVVRAARHHHPVLPCHVSLLLLLRAAREQSPAPSAAAGTVPGRRTWRAPAPQPRGASLRAHHARRLAHSKANPQEKRCNARRLAHSKANPQEKRCKIFVKACKKFLHRFYTVFTRGDCPHRNTGKHGTRETRGAVPMSMLTRRQNEQLTSRGGPRGGFSRRP